MNKALFETLKARSFVCRGGIFIALFHLLFCSAKAQAVKIRFPDEELASESVLPLMDKPQVILNRNVPLKYRVELGAAAGFGLDEPFYLPFYFIGHLAFHITEVHALNLVGTWFPPRLSKFSSDFGNEGALISVVGESGEQGKERLERRYFYPHKAPYPQYVLFLNYQYTPYYGKISVLFKHWVLNLSIYGFAGPGMLVFHRNDRIPAFNLGFGQKLYINKWLGVRGDLGLYGYYGPAIARLQLGRDAREVLYSKIKPEQKRVIVNFLASFGVIFLI